MKRFALVLLLVAPAWAQEPNASGELTREKQEQVRQIREKYRQQHKALDEQMDGELKQILTPEEYRRLRVRSLRPTTKTKAADLIPLTEDPKVDTHF
jgi:hypothetical protein